MSYATALTELNTSTADYFGETIDYAPADGGAAVTGISAVVDFMDAEGEGVVDLPIASVASPQVGSLITLDSDSTTFRIYSYGNKRRGYTECDIRSTDYWKIGNIQANTGSWATTIASLPVFLDEGTATEYLDGDTYRVEIIYTGRCKYNATITEKMRFVVGSDTYYIRGVQKDASQARFLELQLSKKSF